MNEREQNQKAAAASVDQNWDIIPFDEAEDDRRWAQLISNVDELIAQNEQLDAASAAPAPRQNKKPRRKTLEVPPEYELF